MSECFYLLFFYIHSCFAIEENSSCFHLILFVVGIFSFTCRFAERIQRAYRRYRSSRELVSLQNVIHALYAEHQKTRRRESIYCPFSGDSLHQLDSSFIGKHLCVCMLGANFLVISEQRLANTIILCSSNVVEQVFLVFFENAISLSQTQAQHHLHKLPVPRSLLPVRPRRKKRNSKSASRSPCTASSTTTATQR